MITTRAEASSFSSNSTITSIRAQASSSSPITYHVFLSFTIEDSAEAFANHLYKALDQAGYYTFLDGDDSKSTERGESKLERVIKKSKISIIVFSKGNASSTQCLDTLVMILQHKRTSFDPHHVLPLFYDVEPTDVKKQTGCFEEAFKRHEEILKAEEGGRDGWKSKVEKWKKALKEATDFAGMDLKCDANGYESKFIKKIVKEIGVILNQRTQSIGPYPTGLQH
ncbi:17-beta-estradiol 17-dehydrogenase [Bertholletia excelsa]